MTKPIVNLADVALSDHGHGEKYQARIGRIGPLVGAEQLGYNVTAIAPGKRAFPFHNHIVNEEMFLVLEGEGEVRIGDARYPIRKGDVVCCRAGGHETAHQIVNTSTVELRVFAVSTQMLPEVAEYPDSGKFGVLNRKQSGTSAVTRFVGRAEASLDYWEGE